MLNLWGKIYFRDYCLLFFPCVIQSPVIKMLSLYYLCKTIAGNNRLNKVWKKVCTVAAALVDLKYLVLFSSGVSLLPNVIVFPSKNQVLEHL